MEFLFEPSPRRTAPSAFAHGLVAILAMGCYRVTMPTAEELAFCRYLMRRLTRTDFERVRWQAVTSLVTLGISALQFGLMHGPNWPAGTIADCCSTGGRRSGGGGEKRRLTHGVSSLLIAVHVLRFGQ